MTIRPCTPADFDAMLAVINTAAVVACEGIIRADRYHVPYMPAGELRGEIAAGVRFFGRISSTAAIVQSLAIGILHLRH